MLRIQHSIDQVGNMLRVNWKIGDPFPMQDFENDSVHVLTADFEELDAICAVLPEMKDKESVSRPYCKIAHWFGDDADFVFRTLMESQFGLAGG
jgi:hypothetical protein